MYQSNFKNPALYYVICQDSYSSKEVIKTIICKLTGKLCSNILHEALIFTHAHKEMFPRQKLGKTF